MVDDSKNLILKKLKEKNKPFPEVIKPQKYLEMVPLDTKDTEHLWQQFLTESQKLSAHVHLCADHNSAEKKLFEIIADEKNVYCWNDENLPLKNLPDTIKRAHDKNIAGDSEIKIGITGAVAAIAAVGGVVVSSGKGRFRFTSLLPDIHIVLMQKNQICSTFENWLNEQRQKGMTDLLTPSNVVLISGPSRTADIAMELILGMHGPKELHIIVF